MLVYDRQEKSSCNCPIVIKLSSNGLPPHPRSVYTQLKRNMIHSILILLYIKTIKWLLTFI